MNKLLLLILTLNAGVAIAQKVEFKVDNTDLPNKLSPPDFEIVNGQVEIAGEPLNDKPKAFQAWKAACAEWEAKLRDSNKDKDDKIMDVSCGTATVEKDQFLFTYTSTGRYKIKTRIRDKK